MSVLRRYYQIVGVEYDHVKEDEMGRALSTHGGEEESMKGFGGKARRKDTARKT
jgi:hypothetical protein